MGSAMAQPTPAADNADLLKAVYMRWYAERAYEVVQTFTFV